MGEILIRNVDDATVQKISSRALRHGRSLQSEILALIQDGLAAQPVAGHEDRVARVKRIAAMAPRSVAQTDSVVLIREDRDR